MVEVYIDVRKIGMLNQIVEKIGLGELVDDTDDVIVTSKCVICTVLDEDRIMEVCRSYSSLPVTYCPHPFVALSPRNVRDEKASCVIFTSPSGISPSGQKILSYIIGKGFVTEIVKYEGISLSKLARIARQYWFAVFDEVYMGVECHSFLSSATPFFCTGDACNSIKNALKMSNCKELIARTRNVVGEVSLLVANMNHIRRLLSETSVMFKDLLRWLKSNQNLLTGSGFILNDLSTPKLVLRPWIGSVSDPSELEHDLVKASMVMCNSLLVSDEDYIDELRKYGVPIRLTRPYIKTSDHLFDIGAWIINKSYSIVGEKRVVYIDGETGEGRVTKTITSNSVVILDCGTLTLVKNLISHRVPMIVVETPQLRLLFGDGYPLFRDSLERDDVLESVTAEDVATAWEYMKTLSFKDVDAYKAAINL